LASIKKSNIIRKYFIMEKDFKRQVLTGLFYFIILSISAQNGITVSNSQSIDKDSNNIDSNDIQSEVSATFMGGDINVFRDWVQKNLIYPPSAVKQKIFGRIYVKFSIDENGKVYQAEIHQGVHPLLDNEALRVILSSPIWEPAKLNGKNVKQTFIMPVIFILTNKFIKSHSN